MTPPTTKDAPARPWLLIAAGLIVAAGVIWAIAWGMGDEKPRLNDNAVVLTKFVHSGGLEKLPYDEQRQYYKVLDDREDELDQAYRDKRLSESEYRSGLEAAWLGKHINRVEKYFALPAGQGRAAYIDKLLDKREVKRAKPNDPDDIDADETAAEMKVESWPAEVRAQWKLFHDTYREHRKAREKAQKAETKPAAQD